MIRAHVEPARGAVSAIQSHRVERGRSAAGVGHRHLPCPAHTGTACAGVEQVDHAVVGQHVLGFGHAVSGRGGVDIAHRAQAHQQLVRANDGVVAIHIAKAVVGRRRTRGHQHTGVAARCAHAAVAARYGGQGAEVAAALAAGKAHIAHAVIASGVGLACKAGVVVGRDGQRLLGDVGAQARGLGQRVVGHHRTGDAVSRCHHQARAHIGTGKVTGLHQSQGVVVDHAHQAAAAQHRAGGAVVGFVGHGGACHRQGFAVDRDGAGRGIGDGVAAGRCARRHGDGIRPATDRGRGRQAQ